MTSPIPLLPRPASPWPGSEHETRLRWQLDRATGLPDVAQGLRSLAAELQAAGAAGWWLTEPMRNGHLLARRASRRRRPGPAPAARPAPRPAPAWRLRVVAEPPHPGSRVLDLADAARTPILEWTGRTLRHVDGPDLRNTELADLTHRIATTGLPQRVWGLARARLGSNLDLVAAGSALRVHALDRAELVRTHEALAFAHVADGATTLGDAADSYRRAAQETDSMAAVGGVLDGVEDGFVQVRYEVHGR